jgi:acetyltransferase
VAKDEKVGRIVGDVLPDNVMMLRICEKMGFQSKRSIEEPVVKVELDLGVPA